MQLNITFRKILAYSLLGLGILCNEWLLGLLLTADGKIDDLTGLILIYTFEVIAFLSGIAFLICSKSKLKKWSINAVILLGTLIICFFAIEIGIRITGLTPKLKDLTKRHYCKGPDHRAEFDPVIGWQEIANAQYFERVSSKDDWSLHTYNKHGFRDNYDSGDTTVLMFGDSFMRGTRVADSETIEYYLDKYHPEIKFKNLGVGGFGTAQELLLYRRMSKKYDHELVILQYYFNDPADNVDRSDPRRPIVENHNGKIEIIHKPKKLTTQHGSIGNLIENKIKHFFWQKTAIFPFIYYRTLMLFNKPTSELLDNKKIKNQLQRTRGLIKLFSNLTDQNNAKLLIASIPDRSVVNSKLAKNFNHGDARRFWDKQLKMLQSIAENTRNVHHIPLINQFKKQKGIYGSIDKHLTPYGYYLASRSIDRKLHQLWRTSHDNYPKFSKTTKLKSKPSCPEK